MVSLKNISIAFIIATIGLTFASIPTISHAETYRWVDANGVVNYSERKPRGVPESMVTLIEAGSTQAGSSRTRSSANSAPTPGSASESASGDPDNLNADQQAMLKRLQNAEAERQAQVAQIREDNCTRARRVLASLSNTGRIRVVDENGEPRILPEEERTTRIEEAQRGVATNCDV